MAYADHCRKLFDGAVIEVEDLYLLEPYQIADLRQRAPGRALAAVLHAHPALGRFFVKKSPQAAEFLDGLLERHGPAGDDEELRQLADELVWEIGDLLVYCKAPALYDERTALGWDFTEVFATAPVDGKVVIDAGAGTGRVAFAAAPRARHVFAVEPNTSMRHYIRRTADERSIRNLYALDGFLDAIPLPDGSADVLFTSNAIGWWPEQELREVERVVRDCIVAIGDGVPVDRMFLQVYESDLAAMRTIASATAGAGQALDLLTPMPPGVNELVRKNLALFKDGFVIADSGERNPVAREMARAHGGTIFLDEIGEMPLTAQVHLLRVLQHREIERIGGTQRIPVDIRILAATNRNLQARVEAGGFREDLWFRLDVFPIEIPPLRERTADIPALVQHFVERKARELKLGQTPALAPGAIEELIAYAWPGNVRELENLVERAMILHRGEPLEFDLGDGPRRKTSPVPEPDDPGPLPSLDELIEGHIRRALHRAGGQIHGNDGDGGLFLAGMLLIWLTCPRPIFQRFSWRELTVFLLWGQLSELLVEFGDAEFTPYQGQEQQVGAPTVRVSEAGALGGKQICPDYLCPRLREWPTGLLCRR